LNNVWYKLNGYCDAALRSTDAIDAKYRRFQGKAPFQDALRDAKTNRDGNIGQSMPKSAKRDPASRGGWRISVLGSVVSLSSIAGKLPDHGPALRRRLYLMWRTGQ
jgi:hypothetical protein